MFSRQYLADETCGCGEVSAEKGLEAVHAEEGEDAQQGSIARLLSEASFPLVHGRAE